jgi:isopentenyl-diphosphate delta-isomerase
MSAMGFEVVATGGIQTGLDVARSLALGARASGVARAALKAHRSGGTAGAGALLDHILATLRSVMLLTGSRTPAALSEAPRILTGPLRDWLEQTDPG